MDIPEWEGPTVCESFPVAKPEPPGRLPAPCRVSAKKEAKQRVKVEGGVEGEVKEEVKKEGKKKGQRKRPAVPSTNGEVDDAAAVGVKKERAESPPGIKDRK